jgi:2-polyprenyl-3-methyl-5-hydroxy-6-metoxy-1,4-benzoquinol methylase
MKKNKDLESFYSEVYQKGEKNHYTTLVTKKRSQADADEALKSSTWKNKKVLEVGCGTGRFAHMAAKSGATVLAIDFAESAITLAKKNHIHSNLHFKKMNVDDITEKFDVIVSLGTLEHMDNPFETLLFFKKHLNSKGKIILTNPNWTNPRGFVLQTLYHLFNAPITLADLHYLTPVDHLEWAKKLNMKLKWKTFEYSWGNGTLLIEDFKRRLPKILSSTNLPNKKKNIDNFLVWLQKNVANLNYSLPHSGAVGLYVYSKN